jgi:hypothetical protein
MSGSEFSHPAPLLPQPHRLQAADAVVVVRVVAATVVFGVYSGLSGGWG